ncbi:N-6 DNA methylase [Streptomyces griseosporeus]|uniref:N-6 DNA methylase n=1 Tax=Streptomyces griseosporeus TaxID=1910 RepID=UPI0036FC6A94
MALRKTDLFASLWRSCEEQRGGMDAGQYKDYVLTLLFVKYVSDKAKSDPDSLIEVPAGGSFDDMVALKGTKEIGLGINAVIRRLAEANEPELDRVVDLADFNDEERLGKGRQMQERLSRLVTIFADLDFRGSRAAGDDLLADTFAYFMRNFATESGASKDRFYTPAEVSQVLAKVVGIGPHTRQDHTLYDPTCGSGSLLLTAAAEAPRGITVYGQEKDNATWALARMNMILHGHEDADIRKGDSLTDPRFTVGEELRTFDFAVANPPFSLDSWSNGLRNDYGRFPFGRPPEKNGDYAFLLHVLASLKSTGKAAVILPLGVLFRGHAEGAVRRELLRRGYVKGVIGLPPNLFYGTGIPACVIVLDKEHAAARTGVFLVDASRGFVKDGNKNRLRSQDIHRIVDVFNRQTEIAGYARTVPLREIAAAGNDYDLTLARYLDPAEPEDVQDVAAHLHGGIPDPDLDALGAYWEAFPGLRGTLFTANRPGYSDLAVPVTEVRRTVGASEEFAKFTAQVRARVDDWFATHRPALAGIDADTVPADLIARIGDDLLSRFRDVPLLDEYDVYEQLMTYWHDVMHDDVHLVLRQGWPDASTPRPAVDDRERRLAEDPDLEIGTGRGRARYKTDLVPPALVVARCFPAEQAAAERLDALVEEAGRAVEEYADEHAVEDGPLAGARTGDKISRPLAAARLKAARREGAAARETGALHHLIGLYDAETAARKAARDARAALDLATLRKYGELTEPEIQRLVLDDKWAATLRDRITGEADTLVHALVSRVEQLGARYAETVAALTAELDRLDSAVAGHLAAMGADRPPLTPTTPPADWSSVTIAEAAELIMDFRGRTPKKLGMEWGGGDIPVLSARNVRMGYIDFAEDTHRGSEALYRRWMTHGDMERGDVLVTTEAPLGNVAAVPDDRRYILSQRTVLIRPREDLFDKTYFLKALQSPEFQQALAENATGSTALGIQRRRLEQLVISRPPLAEQRRIGRALQDIDDRLHTMDRLLAKQRAVRQGMMRHLLTGRSRLTGQEDAV